MAGVGDYSLLAAIYGLTDEQVAKLQGSGGSAGGYYYNPRTVETDEGPEESEKKLNVPDIEDMSPVDFMWYRNS